MSYFPFFIDITNKPCLIVGGGIVALRKIEKLLPFDVEIIVISPAFCKEIQEMEGIHRICRKFHPTDIVGKMFVIGATDDEAVNSQISEICNAEGILVNIVDDREKCGFFFPALVKKGEFVAGFSSGGGSPVAVQYIRQKVEEVVPDYFDRVVEVLSSVRQKIKTEIPDIAEREKAFRKVFDYAMENNGEVREEEISILLER
ncbi:MAG: bifunctional precorrin-2 dehydrogenase/sirohydrochlorin ferrochelatase [Anaerotignum sp.]|nr:bifunctional precorrin-2 dehydrogenase/sirohydrochlorin ferrochelatase [Anaerotignum sp.]